MTGSVLSLIPNHLFSIPSHLSPIRYPRFPILLTIRSLLLLHTILKIRQRRFSSTCFVAQVFAEWLACTHGTMASSVRCFVSAATRFYSIWRVAIRPTSPTAPTTSAMPFAIVFGSTFSPCFGTSILLLSSICAELVTMFVRVFLII